ncbi:dicarboxylate transporter 1 [Striga asiatica]|uniref:Dicarboxylate transporter 1 n=1 Tax=Striga asiatica TaxID=4170 RepID=A0A5A7RF71_STRAF|nr:dicarboxylate transporter 1 [Striga asiatica]
MVLGGIRHWHPIWSTKELLSTARCIGRKRKLRSSNNPFDFLVKKLTRVLTWALLALRVKILLRKAILCSSPISPPMRLITTTLENLTGKIRLHNGPLVFVFTVVNLREIGVGPTDVRLKFRLLQEGLEAVGCRTYKYPFHHFDCLDLLNAFVTAEFYQKMNGKKGEGRRTIYQIIKMFDSETLSWQVAKGITSSTVQTEGMLAGALQ